MLGGDGFGVCAMGVKLIVLPHLEKLLCEVGCGMISLSGFLGGRVAWRWVQLLIMPWRIIFAIFVAWALASIFESPATCSLSQSHCGGVERAKSRLLKAVFGLSSGFLHHRATTAERKRNSERACTSCLGCAFLTGASSFFHEILSLAAKGSLVLAHCANSPCICVVMGQISRAFLLSKTMSARLPCLYVRSSLFASLLVPSQ